MDPKVEALIASDATLYQRIVTSYLAAVAATGSSAANLAEYMRECMWYGFLTSETTAATALTLPPGLTYED